MDYQPRQELYYREEGMILRVTVLENNSDKKREAYKLRVEDVLKDCFILAKSTKPGKIFECDKLRGVCAGGLWRLTENLER